MRSIPFSLPVSQFSGIATALKTKHLELLKFTGTYGKVTENIYRDVICDLIKVNFETYKTFLMAEEAIIFWALLRATLGDKIPFDHVCECGKTMNLEADISEMKISPAPGKTKGIELDYEGTKLIVDLPLIAQRMDVEDKCARIKEESHGRLDLLNTYIMAAHIQSIEGVTENAPTEEIRSKLIREWILDTPIGFTEDFNELLKPVSPGIDTSIEFTCQQLQCQAQGRVEVPMVETFFRSGTKPKRKKSSI